MNISIKQIVSDYLKKTGYDGLRHPDFECACCLEDLMPCSGFVNGSLSDGCVAGYKIICTCNNHDVDCMCDYDHDNHGFHILDKKEVLK